MAMVKRHEEMILQTRQLEDAGTLASHIAHDFNNILSAIVGYTDLSLRTEDLPGRLKTNLEEVKKASRRAQDLVQQILAISRIEESKVSTTDAVPEINGAIPGVAEHGDPVAYPGDFHMPRGGERILFVDDEETLAEMAGEMLKKLGYTVRIMTDSSEAGKEVVSAPNRYDLMIIDQAMPGVSGLELAHTIMATRPKMPIILYSGYPATVSEDEARAIGIRRVLVKPLSMVLLSQAVRQVLDEDGDAEA
jgi:CheY-like chemotaxis protein